MSNDLRLRPAFAASFLMHVLAFSFALGILYSPATIELASGGQGGGNATWVTIEPGVFNDGATSAINSDLEEVALMLSPQSSPLRVKQEKPKFVAKQAKPNSSIKSASNSDSARGHLASLDFNVGAGGLGSGNGVGFGNGSGSQGTRVVRSPKPPYPWLARVAGFEGRGVFDVLIGKDGIVQDIKVVNSTGREDCDLSAVGTIKDKWVFEPAKVLGFPIETWQKIAVRYELN